VRTPSPLKCQYTGGLLDRTHCSLCVCAGNPLNALQAPSGCPPDVSPRLLDICNAVDACKGLSIEAVTAAAAQMNLSGPAGNHWLVAESPELPTQSDAVSGCVNACYISGPALLYAMRTPVAPIYRPYIGGYEQKLTHFSVRLT